MRSARLRLGWENEEVNSPLNSNLFGSRFEICPRIVAPSHSRVELDSALGKRAKHLNPAAFSVLLVVVGMSSSTARASCGHGVASKLSRSWDRSLSDLEVFRYSPAKAGDSAPAGPRRESPCSGPGCSRGGDLPHAPAPSSAPKSETWCCTTVALRWSCPDSNDHTAGLFTPPPRHTTFPIERPPRTSHPRTSH